MFLFEVTKDFNEEVRKQLVGTKDGEELTRYVLNHERLPNALKGVCTEILKYEKAFRCRLSATQRSTIVNTCASTFIALCRKHREEQNMSLAAKLAMDNDRRRYDDAKGLISEAGTNIKEVPAYEKARVDR